MRRFQWILIALCFSLSGAARADPPDPCCDVDVNGDGVVDMGDFEYCTPEIPEFPAPPECDFDGDGNAFGTSDMAIMSACWGATCAAGVPSLTPTGAGLTAGVMLAAGAWGCRRWRNGGETARLERPAR
jgi:hypothetical protein